MNNTKAEIRQNLKAMRQALAVSGVTAISEIIGRRLLDAVNWQDVRSAHIYKPISKLNEIDTLGFTTQLSTDYPQMEVSIADQNSQSLIPEKLYDVIIVPTLAFDEKKYRLGWGAGWYDRFLAQQPKAIKIGLAYEFSKVASGLPKQPHDIRLDMVITEKQIY